MVQYQKLICQLIFNTLNKQGFQVDSHEQISFSTNFLNVIQGEGSNEIVEDPGWQEIELVRVWQGLFHGEGCNWQLRMLLLSGRYGITEVTFLPIIHGWIHMEELCLGWLWFLFIVINLLSLQSVLQKNNFYSKKTMHFARQHDQVNVLRNKTRWL